MKHLTIEIAFTNGMDTVRKNLEAKSEANMWNLLREVRDQLTNEEVTNGVNAKVFTEDGTLFKDITFKRNAKGKIEMPNAVKATCRRAVEKARKAAKEAAEKLAAKKARKAEANRRYRARKKAQENAAFEALKEKAATEGRIGEFGEIELTAADLKEQN